MSFESFINGDPNDERFTPATARTLAEPAVSVTEHTTKSFQKSEAYGKTEA